MRVGDEVAWRGGFGREAPRSARVTRIEVTRGDKYGDEVAEVDDDRLLDRGVVVDLDNGHWAYGFQLEVLPSPCRCAWAALPHDPRAPHHEFLYPL